MRTVEQIIQDVFDQYEVEIVKGLDPKRIDESSIAQMALNVIGDMAIEGMREYQIAGRPVVVIVSDLLLEAHGIRKNEIGAAATPTGMIIANNYTTNLPREEWEAIMAHELGHIHYKHNTPLDMSVLVDDENEFMMLLREGYIGVIPPIEQEFEADDYAVALGYAEGLIKVLQREETNRLTEKQAGVNAARIARLRAA